MLQNIGRVTFDDQPEWLKVVLPLHRNWPMLILFSLALLAWIVMAGWMVVFLVRDVMMGGQRFAFVLGVIVLIWLVIWYFVGRMVSRRWQYYAATREILFVNKERLIMRRPVAFWGLTEAFDMVHVRPFYISDRHDCPTFDYGNQKIYFGMNLTDEEAQAMVKRLNILYFRAYDDFND